MSDQLDLMPLIRELEAHLYKRRYTLFADQYRGKSGDIFWLRGSFKVGVGSTQVGNLQYIDTRPESFIQHPFKNTAVFLTRARAPAAASSSASPSAVARARWFARSESARSLM